jgi:eukaryotic-like serine/threonine-protein kinase
VTLDGHDRATEVSSDGVERPRGPPDVQPGQIVGRFRLLRPLGKGAMGIVILAHDPELDRNVALKFVRSVGGRSAKRRRERMLREAQAMARLSHRNVVGVLDVGLHGGPDPSEQLLFIAMEYVAAESLAAWLRREHDVGEILQVFIAAGRGLAAAHAAGLVHRDFKPDNVLVGEDARETGRRRPELEVKVTDFGLACASGSTQGSGSASPGPEEEGMPAAADASSSGLRALTQGRLTRTGAATGTPAYMAPEQHLRQTVDERADQFAFCVALYEALYRQSPFEGSDPDQKSRAVLAGRLIAPVRTSGVPKRIWPIVRRGLQKLPAERWGSMNDLLDAMVSAVAPRWHRWAVLGVAVVVATAGGYGASRLFAPPQRCPASEAELSGVWDDARRNQVRVAFTKTSTRHAEETWLRLAPMLDAYASSWHEVYRQVCDPSRSVDDVSSTYDRAMACLVDRRLRLEALVDLLDHADEQTVSAAVRAASGLPSIRPCADTQTLSAEIAPPDDEITRARVQQIRTELASADTLVELGRVHEALATIESAKSAAERIDYPPVLAESLMRLGSASAKVGDTARGRAVLERAYFIATESSDTLTATRTALTLAMLTGVTLQESDAGFEWARHAQAGLTRLADDGTLESRLLTVLGQIHQSGANLTEARDYQERALAIAERVHGLEHLHTAMALNAMGSLLYKTGEFEKAADYLSRGLRAHELALGPSHPMVAVFATNLGLLARKQGDLSLALEHFERAIEVLERMYGPDHFELAAPLNNEALVYLERGEHEPALVALERAVAVTRRAHGDDHPRVALVLSNVAFAQLGSGDPLSAESTARRAVSLYERAHGTDHPYVAASMSLLAESLLAQARPTEARVAAEQTLAMNDSGEAVLWTPDALARYVLARALVATDGDRERALTLAAEAVELYEAADEPAFSRADEVRRWLTAQGR